MCHPVYLSYVSTMAINSWTLHQQNVWVLQPLLYLVCPQISISRAPIIRVHGEHPVVKRYFQHVMIPKVHAKNIPLHRLRHCIVKTRCSPRVYPATIVGFGGGFSAMLFIYLIFIYSKRYKIYSRCLVMKTCPPFSTNDEAAANDSSLNTSPSLHVN